MNQGFRKQVELLLSVMPEVAKESCFALHGGTAINLFVHNMPRLSVDIDLTYIPKDDREEALAKINNALNNIKQNIIRHIADAQVQHNVPNGKLLISKKGANIKIEVNLIGRGTLLPPKIHILCDKAQEDFQSFCEMRVVHTGQLYGGKICAALDRQHPRDLFDIHKLFKSTGITPDIKTGFLLSLLSTNRPAYEILNPNLLDQHETMEKHFSGMTEENFNYNDFESTRERLVQEIKRSLTEKDKDFIVSFHTLNSSGEEYSFQDFPAVKWKLRNLHSLKEQNEHKFQEQIAILKTVLFKS